MTSTISALVADLSGGEARGSALGILSSIMDMGHTTGPLASRKVATYFGISQSFIGASFVVAVVAIIYFITVGFGKGLEKNVN